MTLALILIAMVALAELAVIAWLARRSPASRLIGRTVLLERAGSDVINVRGVVAAEHADRWTLIEAQGAHPSGDVPLQHPVIHVPKDVVLSIAEIPAVRR